MLTIIRTLSDMTKSGQLFFPEYVLAMYLCTLKLKGKDLPQNIPENIKNEISTMIDIIKFNILGDKSLFIPNIRLSFITATDQAKFEQIFRCAVKNGQSIPGKQAHDLLMRSKLSEEAVAHIWLVYSKHVIRSDADDPQDSLRHD